MKAEVPRVIESCSGSLKIGDMSIRCYVLEDGSRMLSTSGVLKALGRSSGGVKNKSNHYPAFIEANNLNPYISDELDDMLTPLNFRTEHGLNIKGYKAEVLPEVCEVYLKARSDGKLTLSQRSVAASCEILMRGFARVGINALVDEVTGYEKIRARKSLEEILDKFISKELRKWAKTFPDEFYQEMFRLRGWEYKPWTVARPSVVGKFTNDLVYDRLAPGVLSELQRLTPRDYKGRTKHRFFQHLTEDVGHDRLREHIASIIALMKASTKWDQFYRMVQRVFPKFGNGTTS